MSKQEAGFEETGWRREVGRIACDLTCLTHVDVRVKAKWSIYMTGEMMISGRITYWVMNQSNAVIRMLTR